MAIGYGTEKEFQTSGISERVKVTPLDSTKFVVAYRDASDSGHGTCKVGTVSGSSITFGAETEFLSVTQVDWVWVAAISSTKFVVVYQDENASDEGYAVVGTVSGTGITFGTRSAFKTGGNVNNICVEMLTSTKLDAFVKTPSVFGVAGHLVRVYNEGMETSISSSQGGR